MLPAVVSMNWATREARRLERALRGRSASFDRRRADGQTTPAGNVPPMSSDNAGDGGGCTGPQPECYGDNSRRRVAKTTPAASSNASTAALWSCHGFPPPGCNGDFCSDFLPCGPKLSCAIPASILPDHLRRNRWRSATIFDSQGVGGDAGGSAGTNGADPNHYECLAFPPACSSDHSCSCLATRRVPGL